MKATLVTGMSPLAAAPRGPESWTAVCRVRDPSSWSRRQGRAAELHGQEEAQVLTEACSSLFKVAVLAASSASPNLLSIAELDQTDC